MAGSPSPAKQGVNQVSLDIRVDLVPPYKGRSVESSFVANTLGQVKCAWIGLSRHKQELYVNYVLPADGQPLSMTFHLWAAHPSAPRMPTTGIVVQQSDSLFLLSEQEVALEFDGKYPIYDRMPKDGARVTMRLPRICQARWAREAPGARSAGGVKEALVYTSRGGAKATDYYIVTVPTTENNPRPGQAVRIQHQVKKIYRHWYAVPTDAL